MQRFRKPIAWSFPVWEARYFTPSAILALSNAYDRGEDDEFVAPTGIGDRAALADGDAVLFMN
ncbi:hypothetical protein N9S57_02475, partial [Luminiphilus sp.]